MVKGIFPVFTSLLVQMPLERIKTIVIFNKSYPGKASERSNSIIEQVDFLSISLLSVSSKDRDCLGSSVLPAPSWNFGANLIWKWGCALGQVSWPLCLFIFAFFAGSVRSLGRSWMNKTAEKKNTPKETWNGLFCRLNHLKSCQS